MNHKLEKIKQIWGRSVVRVLTVLVLSILVPLTAMWVLTDLAKKELAEKSATEAQHGVNTLSSAGDMLFEATEWVVNSFIVNICDLETVVDSVTGKTYELHTVTPERLQEISQDNIYDLLSEFVNYNIEFYSATLIFKPGVLPCAYENGIAASMNPYDTTRRNLLNNFNVFETPFFNRAEQSAKPYISAGKSIEDGELMITYAIPILDSAGSVVGEFWVDCNPKAWNMTYQSLKSSEDRFVGMVNANNLIVNALYDEDVNKNLKKNAEQFFNAEIANKLCRLVQENIKTKKSTIYEFEHGGEYYSVYLRPVERTDFSLVVFKSTREVYHAVVRFQKIFFWVMLASFLLGLACCIYAFRTYKRKNDANYRMFHELSIASSIQRSLLPPNPTKAESDKKGPYDIFGFQRPAKSVGGDLYDYVVKDGLLCFCVGDVSGKGVPAALVMSRICSLFRHIVRTETDPQLIVNSLNNAVLERSDDSMMCTLFVGVINLTNGHFEFCNAGHNPPILVQKGVASYMKIKPNMPVCVFENYPYQKESIDLAPGDRLFAYTDGIPEAKNQKNEFFGTKRELDLLQKIHQLPFNQLVDNLLLSLDNFSNKAEQHDDITVLCLEYCGNNHSNNSKSLHYDKIKGNVTAIVNDILGACGMENDMRLRLAVEEPVQNVADYAYPTDGPLDVLIEKDDICDRVIITLADSGTPFNPLEIQEPDLTSDIAERELGGLGIHFTRQMMEEVSYLYENQQNKLILKYKKNGN